MIGNKSVLAITLARGGSKSVYKKNIANLNGMPLLKYTTNEVKKSKYIDQYFVSTDDDDIFKFWHKDAMVRTFDRRECLKRRVYLEVDYNKIPKDTLDEFSKEMERKFTKQIEATFEN